MSDKIYVNKYISKVVPEDLPWYKRDELMTYIDQLKYKDFISNPDAYLEKTEVINFDLIYARCSRRHQQYSDKLYLTVHTSEVSKMSQKEKKEGCFCLPSLGTQGYFCGKNINSISLFREIGNIHGNL